jgi:hypothetical protein
MWCHKVECQPVVNGAAIGVGKWQVGGFAGFQAAPDECVNQRPKIFARHPHNAHRAPAGGSGNGDDGLLVSAEHGRSKKGRLRGLFVIT